MTISQVQIELVGKSGQLNVGTLFIPESPTAKASGPAVLVATATGSNASFYHRFCRYLASHGCMVFTYDYVGVGQSFPKTAAAAANDDAGQKVKYLQSIAHVDIESWAADLDCILEWFYRQQITVPHQHQPVRRRQLVYISHSVGAHLLPQCKNRGMVDRALLVSCNIAYWGITPNPFIVRLLWSSGVPLAAWWYGYLPMKRWGMMEDLPSGVVKQWARWGHHPDYMCSDPRLRPQYASYTVRDDELSTRQGFVDYLRLLGERPGVTKEHYHLQPLAGRSIGHNGFFLDSNRDLWAAVLPWVLHSQSPTLPPTMARL